MGAVAPIELRERPWVKSAIFAMLTPFWSVPFVVLPFFFSLELLKSSASAGLVGLLVLFLGLPTIGTIGLALSILGIVRSVELIRRGGTPGVFGIIAAVLHTAQIVGVVLGILWLRAQKHDAS